MAFTPTADFVEQPDIILVFHGLMALCQRNKPKQQFEFGCHGSNSSHQLKVKVGRIGSKGEFEENPAGFVFDRDSNFIFSVSGGNGVTPINVYNSSDVSNKRNFSNVIDIEDLYQKRVSKDLVNFSNLIIVKQGLLYTKSLSSSMFTLDQITLDERRVAVQVAINIKLNGGTGILKYKGGNRELELPETKGKPHVIYFENDCDSCNTNDFPLNYVNVIDSNKTGGIKFDLKLSTESDLPSESTHEPDIPIQFRTIKLPPSLDSSKMSSETPVSTKTLHPPISDEAPCTAYGYGNTPEWNPPPPNNNP